MPSPGIHSGDRTATGAGAQLDFLTGAANLNHLSAIMTNAAPDTVANVETSPDGTTWTVRATIVGQKACSLVGLGVNFRYARINVTTLGTGRGVGNPVGGVFSAA